MPRYLAVVLASACAVMVAGFYLMAPAAKPYDLDKTNREMAETRDRLDAGGQAPGMLAALWSKVDGQFETARHVFLGEFFPATPTGWQIAATNHGEIVDFTVDYKLKLTLNDKKSLRSLAGAGGAAQLTRSQDVKFVRGDKVIFLRLSARQKTREKPANPNFSWLFIGAHRDGPAESIAGLTFQRRVYENASIINLTAQVGHDTTMAVLTNAPMADVRMLLSGMDMAAFAARRGLDENGNPAGPIPAAIDGELKAIETGDVEPAAAPRGNMVAGLGRDATETAAASSDEAPKNLLTALMKKSQQEEKAAVKIRRAPSGGGFASAGGGGFTSKCQSASGAKFCSVGGGE
ncbi:MAG: hypothetical protein AAF761_06175 [Pseudomonadota bacterium]